jgi:hypothetical protein
MVLRKSKLFLYTKLSILPSNYEENKKVASDKLMKCAIKSITECKLVFDPDVFDYCRDYFDENYAPDYKDKSLPSKEHIVKLILQDADFKSFFKELIDDAAQELIYAFDGARNEAEDEENERIEEEKEVALLRGKQKKLLDSFSKEQIILLRETFNITV